MNLPAPLCSTGVSRFKAHMGALTATSGDRRNVLGPMEEAAPMSRDQVSPRWGSLLTLFDLPDVPPPNTRRCPWIDLF